MLRSRLFLNLVPFVITLLAVGYYAIVLFSRLSNDVELTVTDNQRSSESAQYMTVALTRMETGLRLAVSGEKDTGATYFRQNSLIFEQNLQAQLNKPGLFKEPRFLQDLKDRYARFREAGLSILALNDKQRQNRIFETDIIPDLLAMDIALDQIRQSNQINILATSENISKIKDEMTRLMILGLAAALGVSFCASYYMGKSILRPIQALTRATREISQDNLNQTVPVPSHDELGELAHAFNAMAARLRAYHENTTEKIVRLHSTMQSALASFPDPIYILDRDGRIELKNPAADQLDLKLGLNDKLPPRLSETADGVLRTGADFLPSSFKESLSLRVGGVEKSYLPRILTMHGEASKVVGTAVLLQDVTRFRLLDDAKSNLVATASHEMKTPLTSVRMVLHMLLEKTLGPLNRQQEGLLQTARTDAERLLRILDDFLDLARLESEKANLKKEATAPFELVQLMLSDAHPLAAAKHLDISCTVEPDLPPVVVDRQRIEHVFQNILSNAIKHSPPGSEILVRAEKTREGNVRFSIRDHGPGIPEEYQNRVFDRMFRVPGQAKTGAGLGLFIAHEIVTAHDGQIGVESQPGHGSDFFVILEGNPELPTPDSDQTLSHPA